MLREVDISVISCSRDVSPELVASSLSLKEIASILLAAKDDTNADSECQTALQAAAEDAYLEVVERLLAVGADFNDADHEGRTALWVAANNGHLEVVERVLAAGANVNAAGSDGRTALQAATESSHPEVVVRTPVLALAMDEGKDMSYKHLETVIKAAADFDRDFGGSGHIENLSSYT